VLQKIGKHIRHQYIHTRWCVVKEEIEDAKLSVISVQISFQRQLVPDICVEHRRVKERC